MADGTSQTWAWGAAGPARLRDAAARGLVARCGCGASARIDPAPWIAERLGEARLTALEGRLRCRCGARGAALALAPEEGIEEAGAIFVWR